MKRNGEKFGMVLLAAGASSRMGRCKLTLEWGGTTVVGHLLATWRNLGAAQAGVVVSPGRTEVTDELDRLSFPTADRIVNPAPERGMFSSVQCAAGWRGWAPGLERIVVLLGDQPHLSDGMLEDFVRFMSQHPEAICQPARRGRPRHPVGLPRSVFEFLAASRKETLKEALGETGTPRCFLACDDPALDLDLDYPEDYERLRPR